MCVGRRVTEYVCGVQKAGLGDHVGPEDQIKIMRLSNKHLLSAELSH